MQKLSLQETYSPSLRARIDHLMPFSAPNANNKDFNIDNPRTFIQNFQYQEVSDYAMGRRKENKKIFKVVPIEDDHEVRNSELKLSGSSSEQTVPDQTLKPLSEDLGMNTYREENTPNTQRMNIRGDEDTQTSTRQYGAESVTQTFDQSSSMLLRVNSGDQSVNVTPMTQDVTIEPIEEHQNISQQNEVEEQLARQRKLEKIMNDIARFKVSRSLITCFIIFLSSILVSSGQDNQEFSLRNTFILAYLFFGYCALEKVYMAYTLKSITSKKREYFLEAMDLISLIICLIFADIRLSGVDIQTRWALFLPGTNIILYWCYSKASKELKNALTIARIFFFIQVFLVAGRLDDVMHWPWSVSLFFIWISLSVMTLFCLFCCVLLIVSAVTIHHQIVTRLDKKTELIGLIWLTWFSGFAILIAVALMGAVQHFDQGNKHGLSLLRQSIAIALYLSFPFIIYIITTFNVLVTFSRNFCQNDEDFQAELGMIESKDPEGIQREKKDVYIVKLTSTYFSSLRGSFIKNSETLDKIKQIINEKKKTKLRRKRTDRLNSLKQQVEGQITGDILAALDLKNPNQLCLPNDRNVLSHEDRFSSITSPNKHNHHDKICWSEADRAENSCEPSRRRESVHDECYICYERLANAVMVECGHGGICLECAIAVIKSKGVCMECRADVTQVLKIEVDPKFRDIIKGSEIITVEIDMKQ